MASVFLSYDRDDAPRAKSLSAALEKAGHNVWWDRQIQGGAQYSKEIERALQNADAVVVLWSRNSVESAWVRDEAAAGRDSGRLVPVALDSTPPPMGFRQYQTIDLSKWRGRGRPAGLQTVIKAIRALGGDGTGNIGAITPETKTPEPSKRVLIGAGIIVLLLVAAAMFVWEPLSRKDSVAVTVRTGQNNALSREFASDLLVKLAGLQLSQEGNLRLLSADTTPRNTDYFLIVSASPKNSGSLLLTSARDGAALWSQEIQPSGSLADVKQRLALTSGQVLGCLLEGTREKLAQDLIQTYLKGCALFSDVAGIDPTNVLPIFRKVVETAPRFEPAWGKMLLAEADLTVMTRTQPQQDLRALELHRRHIREARRINPDMPEAYVAEAALSPRRDFGRRLGLLDRAVKENPHNPVALMARSGALNDVGLSFRAVEDAAQAAKLDQLSPSVTNFYISSLAYTGDTAKAMSELKKAERLWPGTASLRDAQFRFHLRYGDPKIALAIQRSDSNYANPFVSYLEVRIDPTPEKVEIYLSLLRKRLRGPNSVRWAPLLGHVLQVFGEFGAHEQLFPIVLSWHDPNHISEVADIFFRPQLKAFRQDPRFMIVAERAGLLEFWRRSGNWPDFCFTPDQPYDCQKEAAKLAKR